MSGRQKYSKMTIRNSTSQNRAGAIFLKVPRCQGAKGSRTSEITTFCGAGLLPPRLLGTTVRPDGKWLFAKGLFRADLMR